MSRADDRGTFDWLIELAGAIVPAVAAGFAAMRLGPAYGFVAETALMVAFGAIFVIAFAVMRLVPAEARRMPMPSFEQMALPDEELLLDTPLAGADELLLDQPLVATAEMDAVAELLLDDPLPAAVATSRVVQLFADGRMPTAGQLQQRIDRHLARDEQPAASSADGSDALGAALAELRRSLRQA